MGKNRRSETEAVRKATQNAHGAIAPVVPVGHRIKGVSSLMGPDGIVSGQWVKTAAEPEAPEAVIRAMLEDLPAVVVAPRIRRPREPLSDDLLAVYPLGDPHVGLLAWEPETGANFDLRIAEDLLCSAMRDLVLRGPRARTALIANLGDFFHADNPHAKTTNGDHVLDVDGRSARVLQVGFRIMVALIDTALAHHETVIVENRIGNHDGHSAIMLSIGLQLRYHDNPRVTIPTSVSRRSYHEFGSVLLGFDHGHGSKFSDLPSIMAAERPEAWGRTKFRHWLTGHVHHSRRLEVMGTVCESFRTLAGRDAWHAGQGYCAGRDMHRIVFHREHGEIERAIVNVAALTSGLS